MGWYNIVISVVVDVLGCCCCVLDADSRSLRVWMYGVHWCCGCFLVVLGLWWFGWGGFADLGC